MKKGRDDRDGFGKLLDAWSLPEEAGDPIGCVTTSFTFDAAFFEEECLARFLGLQTDASEAPTAYLIEREEKLSQVICAGALVDQHFARGTRSLRWDLLSARLPQGAGILHAKVSLLMWSNQARLIVASANLTEPGYRHNHEVFAALDYAIGSSRPLAVLDEVIEFLRETVKLAVSDGAAASPSVGRWNELLDRAGAMTRDWGTTDTPRGIVQPRVFAVLSGPERETEPQRGSVFQQLDKQRSDKSPLSLACVVSPFFDDGPAETNRPAREIWSLLKQRGEASVEYHVYVEEVPGETALLVRAPELSRAMPENRTQVATQFKRLELDEDRSLHAKCLWLENERTILSMIGSSNFTSAGLGLGKVKNIEANLCFEVARERQPETATALNAAWLPVKELPNGVELRFQQRTDRDDDDSASTGELLPEAFVEVIYSRDESERAWLDFVIRLEPQAPPSGWVLFVEDGFEPFLDESQWQAAGCPSVWRLAWEHERPPSGFAVSWTDAKDRAWWPVNVQSGLSLPPPSELKDLPLELLIEILTSAKPLSQVLAMWLERRAERGGSEGLAELDPHRRVDTSGFLLQRTRRVSWALTALRERLERPVSSVQALNWRLRGPVGVLALAKAIGREAKSSTEQTFLLAELCLELHRVKPQTTDEKCLPVEVICTAIREVIVELSQSVPKETLELTATHEHAALARYVQTVFEKVLA